MRRNKQFNPLMLVLSIVLGAAAWFVCAALYGALVDTVSGPILMGLVFGVLALVMAVGVFLISSLSGTFEKNVITGGSTGSALGFLIVAVLLVGVLGALFQWLYSLRFRIASAQPTSYVFLIDNSGSMSENDPRQLRYDAIEEVLRGQDADFPYMVYGFADSVELMREMRPANRETGKLDGISSGGTAIRNVLSRVIDDYEAGRWDGGSVPKVVMLTDGLPTDFEFFSQLEPILRQYTRRGITISTVGLGDADVALMEGIADSTGGVFVDVSDASMLAQAMASAAARHSSDDLVTTRHNSGSLGLLFGLLRVLFITVLGAAIGLIAGAAYGQTESMSIVLVSSIVKSLIGALLLEVCTSLLGLPDRVLWFILWVLIAALLCTKTAALKRGPERPRGPTRPKRRGGISNRDLTRF